VPKPLLSFNPAEYSLVADRITLFYERYPEGRIVTELVSRDRDVVFRASVFRSSSDAAPAATGWASEREGDGEINQYACLENTETSAIGRALANLGFTASRKRPSREEMLKVERARRGMRVAETRAAAEPAGPDSLGDARSDLHTLLEQAEVRGFPLARAGTLRQMLENSSLSSATVIRIEESLREWIDRHRRTAM
jgi:hypothetical protein